MTYYWHDYETLFRNPRRCRPAQFAAVRTDEDLNVVGEEAVLYAKPAPDVIPDPEACLIHGISPLTLLERGVEEAEFARRIYEELSVPETCAVAYNGVSFDHEVTRFLLYRNLRDPYRWHWDNGCSKWDLIDVIRAAWALRPEGICWPRRDDGTPSFKLEDLAAANGIEHRPHDALSDVRSTIELARIIKRAQPRLFEYGLSLRFKRNVQPILQRPCLFVSSMIPAASGCATVVAPVCPHPQTGAIIAFDLRFDPEPYVRHSAASLRELLFTKNEDMPADVKRPPILSIKPNGAPFVANLDLLNGSDLERMSLDLDRCRENNRKLLAVKMRLAAVVSEAFERTWPPAEDVDLALYERLPEDGDRAVLDRWLSEAHWDVSPDPDLFVDDRMPELCFRYRARNHWHCLRDDEKIRWHQHCRSRHLPGRGRPDGARTV